MSMELRARILLLLEEHSRTGAGTFVNDTELAAQTGAPVVEVGRQMDVLAAQGMTRTANTLEGRSARLSPQGTLAVEALLAEIEQVSAAEQSKAPIGFKTA